MTLPIERRTYAQMYGPTTGDRVRLADTELFIEVEQDLTVHGDEVKFGGGKVLRDGMGQSPQAGADEAPDLLITNALIVDHWGIIKADIGIKDGNIAAIGKAGNPALMAGVHPQLVVGASTEVVAGEGMIVTPGGIDAHIHFICPQQIPEAIASGITTLLGGGTGPATRHQRHDVHAGAVEHPPHAAGRRGVPDQPGLPGQGQRLAAAAAARADRGRGAGSEAARGLGLDPGRHRLLSRRGGGIRRAGGHPHRHAQRGRLRRGLHRGVSRPHHPYLPHRGRRRRPRPRHPAGMRRGQRAAVVHQPDTAFHRQHAGRASRHAHGLPPPRRQPAGGHGLRGVAHPPRGPSPPRTSCTIWAPSA